MKRLYKEMLIATIAAGVIAWSLCPLLLDLSVERKMQPVLVGLCFGLAALLSQVFAALTDRIFQRIGQEIHRGEMVSSVKERAKAILFILLFAIAVALGGALLQLLYQLDGKGKTQTPEPPEQFVILIDNSGSMNGNDPQNVRFSVTEELTASLSADKPVAILGFTESTLQVHPLLPMSLEPLDRDLLYQNSYGGTNVNQACRNALDLVKKDGAGKRTRFLLLTDGACSVLSGHPKKQHALAGLLQQANCEVFAIGFGQADERSLRTLAEETGGAYYYVSELSQLQTAVESASTRDASATAARRLTSLRTDRRQGSILYALFRILAITALGMLIALFDGFILAFRSQMRHILRQGLVKSLAAGVLTELLCAFYWERIAQLVLWVLLTVLCLLYIPAVRGAGSGDGTQKPTPEAGSEQEEKTERREDVRVVI